MRESYTDWAVATGGYTNYEALPIGRPKAVGV